MVPDRHGHSGSSEVVIKISGGLKLCQQRRDGLGDWPLQVPYICASNFTIFAMCQSLSIILLLFVGKVSWGLKTATEEHFRNEEVTCFGAHCLWNVIIDSWTSISNASTQHGHKYTPRFNAWKFHLQCVSYHPERSKTSDSFEVWEATRVTFWFSFSFFFCIQTTTSGQKYPQNKQQFSFSSASRMTRDVDNSVAMLTDLLCQIRDVVSCRACSRQLEPKMKCERLMQIQRIMRCKCVHCHFSDFYMNIMNTYIAHDLVVN